jgi:hypothetical protein
VRRGAQDGSISRNFGSTTGSNSLSPKLSLSGSIIDMKEGIWSSYIRLAAAEGMFVVGMNPKQWLNYQFSPTARSKSLVLSVSPCAKMSITAHIYTRSLEERRSKAAQNVRPRKRENDENREKAVLAKLSLGQHC